MNANQQVKATIKAHGLKVGDRFNFHGLGSEAIPTAEATRVELGKVGNRYMLTTVTGDVITWEFGTSAQIWADTSVDHAVTTATRTLDNGDTVYVAECEHGWSTGLHTSADDAAAVALGHGEVSRDLYVAPQAELISIPTDGDECLCDEIFAQRKAGKVPPVGGLYCPGDGSIFTREGTEASDDVIEASAIVIKRESGPFNPTDPSTWNEANLPAGWSWVECADSLGEYHLFTPEGTDHSEAYSMAQQAKSAQRLADATAMLSGMVGRVLVFDGSIERIVTHMEANTVWLVTVGQDQAKQYPLVGLYEHITQGRIVALDACDIAEGNAQAWAEAGSPRDAAGQPFLSFADRLHDELDGPSPITPSLPIRIPGASWELIEAEIWAGTDLVEPMRRSRLSRKGKRALERAFREGCCGRADHERWCRTWRPITKRHAARMGIDRKDAVLLRPKFADLLAARVGK